LSELDSYPTSSHLNELDAYPTSSH
jgi:hypothetical protein